MAGCVVVAALVGLGVAHVAVEATQRARAQNAADAAALAAALRLDPADARRVAGQVAAHNGATVTEVQRFGATTVVRVTIAGHRAVAAARPVTASSAVAP